MHSIILLIFNANPRQSAVTSLSSTEENVLCLIAIVIAGNSETEADSRDHVGRVTRIPSPLRPRVRPRQEAGKMDPPRGVDSPGTPDMTKVWTALGVLAISGAAVIVGPQPPSSMLPIL